MLSFRRIFDIKVDIDFEMSIQFGNIAYQCLNAKLNI